MKKALITLAFFAAMGCKAQTIDTTMKSCTAVRLSVPLKVRWNDTINATHLCANLMQDDLKNSAIVTWQLVTSTGTQMQTGFMEMKGQNYLNWDGSNLYLFKFIADKLGLQLKK